MFYIYLGHLGHGAGKLYFFVFSFHVPLFFFISGLVFKGPKTTKELYFIAQKTFRSIIIPFIIFSLIGVAFLTIKNQSTAESVREMLWQSALGIRNNIPLGSLWFLPCLFVVILYHSLLELVIKSKVIVFLIAMLFYIFTPSWWDGVPKLVFNLGSRIQSGDHQINSPFLSKGF
jgi:fucose 4-O-acetylase-like acetyltransferase